MELKAALELLGPTAEDVARALHVLGCAGRPKDSTRCPVAHYLRARGVEVVGVALDSVAWAAPDDRFFAVGVPPAVQEFLRRFDAGAYPQLVEARGQERALTSA